MSTQITSRRYGRACPDATTPDVSVGACHQRTSGANATGRADRGRGSVLRLGRVGCVGCVGCVGVGLVRHVVPGMAPLFTMSVIRVSASASFSSAVAWSMRPLSTAASRRTFDLADELVDDGLRLDALGGGDLGEGLTRRGVASAVRRRRGRAGRSRLRRRRRAATEAADRCRRGHDPRGRRSPRLRPTLDELRGHRIGLLGGDGAVVDQWLQAVHAVGPCRSTGCGRDPPLGASDRSVVVVVGGRVGRVRSSARRPRRSSPSRPPRSSDRERRRSDRPRCRRGVRRRGRR